MDAKILIKLCFIGLAYTLAIALLVGSCVTIGQHASGAVTGVNPRAFQKHQLPILVEFSPNEFYVFSASQGRLRVAAFGPSGKNYHPRHLEITPVSRSSIELTQREP